MARGCDPFYVGASNCVGAPKYHPDLDAHIRDGLSVGDVTLATSTDNYNTAVAEDATEFLETELAMTFLTQTPAGFEGATVRVLPNQNAVPANSYVPSR